ncbi:MAG: glycoside hydrolase family 127 protein, partial [Eubacterium sp.]|nr:glycoside hydrolase family 127 protein [Eubacterium sp.]
MKKKFFRAFKGATAVTMALAMATSLVPDMGIPSQAATVQDRDDDSILYFVDCGDINPATVPSGDQLGTHNSVTDQLYGADEVTGFKWGINDAPVGGDDDNESSGNGSCSVGGVSSNWTWPYEFTSSDQDDKTATNRYTKNQYEKRGSQDRELSYKFELENGTYLVEVGFVDPWGCSKSPSVYAYYGQDDQQVLKENFDVSTNSGVLTSNVTVKGGELVLDAIGSGDDNKAINMTYITIKESGDAANVAADLAALSIPESTTADLELPTKGSKMGSTINWTSSNPEVIATDGSVTRPASGKNDVEVTLTAEITYGSVTKTETFKVTVIALNELMGADFLEKESVEVTDAYYDNALELDVKNLLLLDPDRLLAGFRQTACYVYNTGASNTDMTSTEIASFMKNKSRYGGGWEDSLIGGHTLGHYLTALAQATVNPGLSEDDRDAVKERLNYMIDGLTECQEKTVGTDYEGYIFGATLPSSVFKSDPDLQFDNVENGYANISTQAWVPWYTMHKILAGVVDSYQIAGNEDALVLANNLGTWIANRVNKWTESKQSIVLGIEYGGMNDALYQLYKVTNASNKEDFLTAAHQFDETKLFENVLAGTNNVLNGKHANTTIPKFLGALCRYEVDQSETKYLQYA